jgi:tetratricopeptide (TPR) repeat protein
MSEDDRPHTRLEQILRQRHWTVRTFLVRYREAAGEDLSERQAYRWISGGLQKLPYPHACAALEKLFGEPVARLFGPPYGAGAVTFAELGDSPLRGAGRRWEGQVIAMAAGRARDFLARIEVSNVGQGTLDQLVDDVRRLVQVYQQLAPELLLPEIADTQERAFTLLEGRQRPDQARDLYLLAGITSGLMAKASHDLGSPHEALGQARTAHACADNAGHDGLRAWARGLQALITYWAGRPADSVRYAELGAEAAERTRGTAAVWLLSGKARALSALGRLDDAHAAIDQATELRDRVQPDELDELGGLCTFSRPRQLYYAADALAWGGGPEAHHTERLAMEALAAYDEAPAAERAFGDEAGTRCDLAVARVFSGEIDGAAEAIAPVLALPAAQRINGIVTSAEHVQRALLQVESASSVVADLRGALENFTATRLALPR